MRGIPSWDFPGIPERSHVSGEDRSQVQVTCWVISPHRYRCIVTRQTHVRFGPFWRACRCSLAMELRHYSCAFGRNQDLFGLVGALRSTRLVFAPRTARQGTPPSRFGPRCGTQGRRDGKCHRVPRPAPTQQPCARSPPR
jgi:hypothetical protein